jgi:hypothetical protein
MEVESTGIQDVAEPDQVVSGAAGTGQEFGNEIKIVGKDVTHKRVVIGLGVLYNGVTARRPIPYAGQEPGISSGIAETGIPEPGENPEKLVFSLFDPRDRVQDRIQKKIDRHYHRIMKLEDRRRSQ